MKYLCCSLLLLVSNVALSQKSDLTTDYEFSSIELLIEQEVGRIVLPQIYQNLGINIAVSPLPADRAQYVANSGLKGGEIMRIWSYGKENSSLLRVATPYYKLETMAFILRGSGVEINKKEDLEKYRIAKVRGVKHTNNITKWLPNVYNTTSTQNMMNLLLKGKVDVALTNTLDGVTVIKRLGFSNIVPIEKSLATEPLYHYIHKKHRHLVPLVDNEIKRLKQSGKLEIMIKNAEKKVIEQYDQA
ncbi:transporter substrate-binding domain-containing protein [Thalassotalea sp. M1531]|uniref:Transporter substrate-binding domain-containing protein n=1 Tax=Thalassotalea algicola TaxID=2716224 RepID=A0A7Y0LDU2_9GAMM|nr:transporter substrate-binding domain-containing protein [Thalassotalea algicola]NMP32713.1 transporter substrate-binding domain-containing protein [Thalassotalea algicola]